MAKKITNLSKNELPDYGAVRTPAALGQLVRRERKRQQLTLDAVYSATGLTTRFLSEFERGKPHASLGLTLQTLQALGLEMLILPRSQAERLRAACQNSPGDSDDPVGNSP